MNLNNNRQRVYTLSGIDQKDIRKETILNYCEILKNLKESESINVSILSDSLYQFFKGLKNDEDLKEILDASRFVLKKIIEIEIKNKEYIGKNSLFKYRKYDKIPSNNTIVNNTIINNTVMLSNCDFFNDPIDPPIKLKKDIFKNFCDVVDKIRIASLSERKDSIL